MTDESEVQYRAVVQDVILRGKRGPYVVTTAQEIRGAVTFSLSPEVWKEGNIPQAGHEVILSNVVRKPAGWRAYSARFVRPSDPPSNQ